MSSDTSSPDRVWVVDDDDAILRLLGVLLESKGYEVESFVSGDSFLASFTDDQPGCILLDVVLRNQSGMQRQNGIELLRQFRALGYSTPVIFMTGYGDIPTAVEAMRLGALDFLEKPCVSQKLVDCVQEAVFIDREQHELDRQAKRFRELIGTLTPRETEVMQLVVQGIRTKHIAQQLGISQKTVEVYRSAIRKKMGVESVPQLVRLVTEQRFWMDPPKFLSDPPAFPWPNSSAPSPGPSPPSEQGDQSADDLGP